MSSSPTSERPSLEHLRSATTKAVKLLKKTERLGVVSEGAFADLLVLDKDPMQDVPVLSLLSSRKTELLPVKCMG